MNKTEKEKFAVIGNPVSHSCSPDIHQAFASQFGISLIYEKMLATGDNFNEIVDNFFSTGGRGLNITTPFKSLAARYVSCCSHTAKKSNSVNTLYYNDTGVLSGDSTDGRGWLADIQRLNIDLAESKILVVGAGGVARIIINTLLSQPITSLHVCNRTKHRAEDLLDPSKKQLSASGLQEIPDKQWDLVINTLSVGWQGTYPDIDVHIKSQSVAYDVNYGQGAKPFKGYFTTRGGQEALFYDGWGMLVEQAAESFNLWWGRRPETGAIINGRNTLSIWG